MRCPGLWEIALPTLLQEATLISLLEGPLPQPPVCDSAQRSREEEGGLGAAVPLVPGGLVFGGMSVEPKYWPACGGRGPGSPRGVLGRRTGRPGAGWRPVL